MSLLFFKKKKANKKRKEKQKKKKKEQEKRAFFLKEKAKIEKNGSCSSFSFTHPIFMYLVLPIDLFGSHIVLHFSWATILELEYALNTLCLAIQV